MKKIILLIGAIIIVAFAYWTISPLFITNVVQDELPVSFQSEEELVEIGATMPDVVIDKIMPTQVQEVPSENPLSIQAVFPITGTRGHSASGDIRVVNTEAETIVRYENYEGTNGPDLFVYLAKDLDATEFINLGRARGNQGNINYSVPEDVDLSEYTYVLTWCQAFGVLFDYAEIN